MRFLDTNVFVRYLAGDDLQKSEACRRFWQQVDAGEEMVTTTEVMIAEVCYVLSSRRLYNLTHQEVAARLRPLLSLPGLKLVNKRRFLRALDLYAGYDFLDFEDALAVAHMEGRGLTELVSYDQGFDSVPGITRVEP